jgi:hypothetical protein
MYGQMSRFGAVVLISVSRENRLERAERSPGCYHWFVRR